LQKDSRESYVLYLEPDGHLAFATFYAEHAAENCVATDRRHRNPVENHVWQKLWVVVEFGTPGANLQRKIYG